MDVLIEHLQKAHYAASDLHHERRQEALRARQEYLTERTTSKRMEAVRAAAAELHAAAVVEAARQAYIEARDLRAVSRREED